MPEDDLRTHAEQFLRAAMRHPECRGGRIEEVTETRACLGLDINVEMPLHIKVDGISPAGVRRNETARVVLGLRYPWSSPTFYLRADFSRSLPHLQPGPLSELPRPCLVDGHQREFFFQFGLVEGGVFHLVEQLVRWLRRAAEGTLMDPEQGWEPTLRRDLSHLITLNAEACRAMVDRHGGHRILKARFSRSGSDQATVSGEMTSLISVADTPVPLKRGDNKLFRWDGSACGDTVCCIIWPDKLPSGDAFIADTYLSETVTSLSELLARAEELGCARALSALLGSLQRCFDGYVLRRPIPLAVIFCARRPFPLIGSSSDIELLPYVLEIRAEPDRTSLFAAGDDEPVAPAMQIDETNPTLLRNVSGAPELGPVAMLGCGSVGSKMAMHLARSGISIAGVSDRSVLMPHNMARHALARPGLAASKADELAAELGTLGQSPPMFKEDLVAGLASRDTCKKILPRQAAYAVNSTASLAVREALSHLCAKDVKPRLVEAALFGRGHGGFLLIEGEHHNPTLSDLMAELYAGVQSDRERSLMFDGRHELTEVQIGQGCGSLTMPMTDMRLSAMTAGLTEALVEAMEDGGPDGQIVIGTTAADSPNTSWSRRLVAPFEVIEIEQARGWTLRVSQQVLAQIRADVARHPGLETGGVMIGTSSARLRTVNVVDLLPAPPDSVRTATCFTLGTSGLANAIRARHRTSGNTLFDVGTWHSHLTDQGPSPLDRKTARELAGERPPPSALLVATPNRYFGLMHTERAV